jgi:hypothetical protein
MEIARNKTSGGFISEADSTSPPHSLLKNASIFKSSLVVEVPGIEPGSFSAKVGLLRA